MVNYHIYTKDDCMAIVNKICSKPIYNRRINTWFVLVEDNNDRLVRIFGKSKKEVQNIKIGDNI